MTTVIIDEVLDEIQSGNDLARERMINHYKSYILSVASRVCNRYISWNDEESSIALIAFNRAIDTFSKSGGRSFLNYGYLLIQRDLIDYFRKEKKNLHFSLHDDEEKVNLELDKSIEVYEQSIKTTELVDEILELDELLKQFKISFEELEHYSPKHEDTRKNLLKIADDFASDRECVEWLLSKKHFPMTVFSKRTGYKKKTLERHRKYVITLILLKLNPQWVQLRQYIQSSNRKEGNNDGANNCRCSC